MLLSASAHITLLSLRFYRTYNWGIAAETKHTIHIFPKIRTKIPTIFQNSENPYMYEQICTSDNTIPIFVKNVAWASQHYTYH